MRKLLLTVVALVAFALVATPATATTIDFYKITNNGNVDVSSQLSVEVTDGGGSTVVFKFLNNVGITSSITDIYFDDGTLLGISNITPSLTGVSFTQNATPGDLPGGQDLDPPFETSQTSGPPPRQKFSADSTSPHLLENGVNASNEFVKITFNLINGKTFADTLAALDLAGEAGGLRIGLHVQAIGTTGKSDSYVNCEPTGGCPELLQQVPDGGATIGLLGLGILGLGYLRRRLS